MIRHCTEAPLPLLQIPLNMSFFDSPSWHWRWSEMCGAAGFQIWSQENHDLGLCFQHLFLQIPVLALLAMTSAYFCGRHFDYVVRGKLQMRAINFRCLLVLALAISPIIQTYIDVSDSKTPVPSITFFLSAVQCITWLVHFCYVLVLRKRLGVSPRGPVQICVLWTLYAVLSVIHLHSYCLFMFNSDSDPDFETNLKFRFSIVEVVLHALYALSLCPSEGHNDNVLHNYVFAQVSW